MLSLFSKRLGIIVFSCGGEHEVTFTYTKKVQYGPVGAYLIMLLSGMSVT